MAGEPQALDPARGACETAARPNVVTTAENATVPTPAPRVVGARVERRLSALAPRLALLAFGTVLPVATAEIGLRTYHAIDDHRRLDTLPPIERRALVPSADPRLVYELNRGWTQQDFRVNAAGMVGRDVTAAKPPNVIRIAVVGDSISCGLELIPQNQTFPSRMQVDLDALGPDAPRFEVLNFGVNGYGILRRSSRWRGRGRSRSSQTSCCCNRASTIHI